MKTRFGVARARRPCHVPDARARRPRHVPWLATAWTLVALAVPLAGQTTAPAGEASFLVSRFVFSYARPDPGLPPLADVFAVTVPLTSTPEGLSAAQAGRPITRIRLGENFTPPLRLQAGTIQRIDMEVVGHFNRLGLVGIVVAPSEKDIDPQTLKDLRPPGQTDLHLVIQAGKVSRVTASAPAATSRPAGPSPSLRRILANSPVKPADALRPGETDLLRKDLLDDYMALLNRHPGRRVDVAVSPAGEGEVSLDYLVSQLPSPTVYAQAENTGPRNTPAWRQRFGLIDNQLTGNDDILSVEYITAGFQDEQAVVASYEAPLGNSQRLRWRAYANWAQYSSFDVGILSTTFSGQEEQFGAELIWNFFQHRRLFVDLIGGAYGRIISASDEAAGTHGRAGLFVPYAGLRAERVTNDDSLWALATVEGNASGIAGTEPDELALLGRANPDRHWVALKWNSGASFYLERLLGVAGWTDPRSAATAARANEIALLFHGQYAGGYRLIPQAQEAIGGLYSVRGYPTAIAAGDSAMVGTAEYRWHIPRAFGAQAGVYRERLAGVRGPGEAVPPARPFGPVYEPLGGRDWDLIAKTFFDVGRSLDNDRQAGEPNETLMGWGVGLELLLGRNFSIRCDWAMALRDMSSGAVDAGSNRFYVVATFSW